MTTENDTTQVKPHADAKNAAQQKMPLAMSFVRGPKRTVEEFVDALDLVFEIRRDERGRR